ncbi:MAG: signal peptide peptidase SppA [Verrucomicrobiota bacterium]
MDDNLPPVSPSSSRPPLPPPPIIIAPAQKRPAKTGRGWKIFAIVLLVALIISVTKDTRKGLHGITSPGRAVQQGEQLLDEVIVENNSSENKIALVDVEGIIASSPIGRTGRSLVESIQDQMKTASRDEKVKAIVLRVNSPGGEVLASDEIYNVIADFQKNTKKPVVASMGSLAASGGYYVSAPCRWIVANEMTLTGSIGVIMHGYNYRGLMDKLGVRPETFKSGKFKDMLSGDREGEIPEEEREMVQGLIMETYGKFTNIVAAGREEANLQNKSAGRALASDWTEYADGRVLSGKQALKLGLVDELGDFKAAVKRAQKLANLPNANLIQYQERFGLENFFRIFGKTETPVPSVKIDLGLDFPKLQLGRLYFMTPTTLP